MSTFNREIIGIHRIPSECIYQLGCDLSEATKRIQHDLTYREQINPDISGLRINGPAYMYQHVMPKFKDESLNRWAGIQVEHVADPRRLPKVLGLVVVRPKQRIKEELHRSHKPEREVTLVDVWTTAENHDDSYVELLERGKEVAENLYPSSPVVTVEPVPVLGAREEEQPTTYELARDVFTYESAPKKVSRPDLTRTIFRDGRRKAKAVIHSDVYNVFDV